MKNLTLLTAFALFTLFAYSQPKHFRNDVQVHFDATLTPISYGVKQGFSLFFTHDVSLSLIGGYRKGDFTNRYYGGSSFEAYSVSLLPTAVLFDIKNKTFITGSSGIGIEFEKIVQKENPLKTNFISIHLITQLGIEHYLNDYFAITAKISLDSGSSYITKIEPGAVIGFKYTLH